MSRRNPLDKRIQLTAKKLEENKKPLSFLVITGIVLISITYFIFIADVIRFIFGIGANIFVAIGSSYGEVNSANSSFFYRSSI
jgi:hypothetical protein